MRIELNAGGLSNGAAVMDFQSDFGALSKGSRWMVQSFQNIRNYAYNMNGGVGILQDAVDEISARITEDEQRAGEIEKDLQKADDFIELALSYDAKTAVLTITNIAKGAVFTVETAGRKNDLRSGMSAELQQGSRILLGNYTTIVIQNIATDK